MTTSISKSRFKPHALKYFRQVQETGKELIITDHGKPVLKIIPYRADPMDAVEELRNSIVKFEAPTEPVAEDDWEALK